MIYPIRSCYRRYVRKERSHSNSCHISNCIPTFLPSFCQKWSQNLGLEQKIGPRLQVHENTPWIFVFLNEKEYGTASLGWLSWGVFSCAWSLGAKYFWLLALTQSVRIGVEPKTKSKDILELSKIALNWRYRECSNCWQFWHLSGSNLQRNHIMTQLVPRNGHFLRRHAKRRSPRCSCAKVYFLKSFCSEFAWTIDTKLSWEKVPPSVHTHCPRENIRCSCVCIHSHIGR